MSNVIQRHPPEVFYEKRCSQKFRKIHRKTTVRVSFLMKLQAPCNFIKNETLAQVFSCGFCEISENTFFTERVRTTASGHYQTFIDNLFLLTLHCVFIFLMVSTVQNSQIQLLQLQFFKKQLFCLKLSKKLLDV